MRCMRHRVDPFRRARYGTADPSAVQAQVLVQQVQGQVQVFGYMEESWDHVEKRNARVFGRGGSTCNGGQFL